MNEELIQSLKEIVKEKGIDAETLFSTIEDALINAYKKNYGINGNSNVKVNMDRENGDIHVYSEKKVCESVQDPISEISLQDAKKINPVYKIDDIVDVEVTPKKFGRIAAQSAKQLVIQRLKEAERSIVFNEFTEKEYDIVTGTVLRKDRGNVLVSLGKTEAVLTPNEQIPGEQYNFNDKIKLYIAEVKSTSKGPQIIISRTHPGLVKRLFELEVPEIFNGIVEIKSISREAGSRTKIAVYSNDENVDAMGACVGPRGIRVQNIVSELKNEKIDIIKWSKYPEEFIANSLSPAKVIDVSIDEDSKSAKVIVDDNQLSLAIGKEGQNVRLAAKLTGWKIDIKSKSQEDKKKEAESAESEDKNEEAESAESEVKEEEVQEKGKDAE